VLFEPSSYSTPLIFSAPSTLRLVNLRHLLRYKTSPNLPTYHLPHQADHTPGGFCLLLRCASNCDCPSSTTLSSSTITDCVPTAGANSN